MDLCVHLQARRRQLEEIRTPLAPALGVAATVYTHQIANVLRVLTDVRVRHLLADEVGLGKTVQALMVLNALRRQRRDLRALVVVPDRLVPQWRDELMARAHTAAFDREGGDGEGQFVRLAWEDQLRRSGEGAAPTLALTDIDPAQYQVLIVDELHRLRTDLQDRIVRVASDFEHVLILTATPSFQRPERHSQLFALLEPERTARARWEIASSPEGVAHDLVATDDLSRWPEWAAQRVVDLLLDRDRRAAVGATADTVVATAMAESVYRRVIRTRRVDYSGVLPRRRHRPVVVEPLGAEVDRQSLMWRYFRHLGDLTARFDPVLLAKRVILSPPSLEQRVDFFRRRGHERDGLLERVKPLVHRNNGDSRADALVDLLAGVWARSADDRVLVAAQDNLTVDYLFDLVRARLPEVGPLDRRVPLVAARVRQGMTTDAVEDLGGYGNETSENLDAFQRGDAHVLFAPEAAQVGLNLQCARVLVLYSVPWKPEEVEQWIGRLDRIGNVAAFSEDGGAKSIDVYTIAQRGLVDEKVVTVLQRFHVFERSVNLDGSHLSEVAQLIEDAALRPDEVRWSDLEDRAAVMAAEDEVEELSSALRAALPWDAAWAKGTRAWLDDLPPVSPVLGGERERSWRGPTSWDRGVEPLFKLLSKSGDYHVRSNKDPETGTRYRSLWYRFGERGMYGHKPVTARVVFTFGADPSHDRSPKNAHAFLTRRADIESPPRREVTLELDVERVHRPLRFASFGDALHDELVDEWAELSPEAKALDVTFFADHALWEHCEPGLYLARMAALDAARALPVSRVLESVIHAVAGAVARVPLDRLEAMVAPFTSAATCAIEADVRWLRASLPAVVDSGAWSLTQTGRSTLSAAAFTALVDPMAHGKDGVPRAAQLTDERVVAAANRHLNELQAGDAGGRDAWSHLLPAFEVDLHRRVGVLREEARDAVALARREVERAEAAVADALERGNRAQITRAENLLDVAADVADMTDVYWERRIAWLTEIEDTVIELTPEERFVAVIRARRLT